MASILRTLQNLRDGVADVADVNVAASGVRHTNALVDARINRAFARWYTMLAEAGDDSYIKRATVTTTPGTATTFGSIEANRYVIIPDIVMFVRGCDIYYGSTPTNMLPFDLMERNDAPAVLAQWDAGLTGRPMFYRLTSQAIGSSGTQPSSVLEIFPWCDAAYRMDVWYIPGYPLLINSSDTMECISSGDEWVINEAALHTLRTDGLADSPVYAALTAENAKIEQEMRFSAACRAHVRKIDTAGMRAALRGWQ